VEAPTPAPTKLALIAAVGLTAAAAVAFVLFKRWTFRIRPA
jgi:putative flippase GtrA